jgi:hypothetical protein
MRQWPLAIDGVWWEGGEVIISVDDTLSYICD